MTTYFHKTPCLVRRNKLTFANG